MYLSLILTHPKRGSMLLDRLSYMDREDMTSTDTGRRRRACGTRFEQIMSEHCRRQKRN